MFLKKWNKSLSPKEYGPERKEKPQDLCVFSLYCGAFALAMTLDSHTLLVFPYYQSSLA